MKALARTFAAALVVFLSAAAWNASAQMTQTDMAAQMLPADSTDMASEEFPEFDPTIAAENGYEVEQDKTGDYKVVSSSSAVMHDILLLLERFLFNLLVCWIIVHFFYFRKNGRRNYYFTFLIFSSAMFLLLFVMNNLSLQIGFTLGLFAIFGMIRYRTETVPVREMTYLFIIIALSVINGIGAEIPFLELAVANALIVLLILLLEASNIISKKTSTKLVTYDRIELITPERREELIADLEKRLGVKVKEIEVGAVDFIKDSTFIKVTYENEGKANTVDTLARAKDYVE